MGYEDKLVCGIVGTAVSAAGTSLAISDAQAIISIVITVAGFIISVVIPFILKIVKKIKDAKADGKITEDEAKDIMNTVIEDGKDVLDQAKEITNKEKKE